MKLTRILIPLLIGLIIPLAVGCGSTSGSKPTPNIGTIWFGTWGNGVSKYDDAHWTTYNTSNSGLGDNNISAIAIDGKGNKWFGVGSGFSAEAPGSLVNGISEYDGNNWTTYTTSNSGLACSWVAGIAVDSAGDKWFDCGGGSVSEYDGINWTTYGIPNVVSVGDFIQPIVIDKAGNKWIGSISGSQNVCNSTGCIYYAGGVSEFNGTSWITYNTLNSGLVGTGVSAIAIDNAGNKWFGTDSGVSEFDGTNWTTYTSRNSGLAGYGVDAIVIDSAGNKWFGTEGSGVSEFDGTHWTTYNITNSGLASNNVSVIAIDSAGNKWFGTEFSGVSEFDGTHWITYNTSNSGIAGDWITAIAIESASSK